MKKVLVCLSNDELTQKIFVELIEKNFLVELYKDVNLNSSLAFDLILVDSEFIKDVENIKNINLNKYRALLSYTPQDVFLFSDTIENNILFGNLETTFAVICIPISIFALPSTPRFVVIRITPLAPRTP